MSTTLNIKINGAIRVKVSKEREDEKDYLTIDFLNPEATDRQLIIISADKIEVENNG
jgi:hypothetical protein